MRKFDDLEITPYYITWCTMNEQEEIVNNKIHLVVEGDNSYRSGNSIRTACGRKVTEGNGTWFENQSYAGHNHCKKCQKAAMEMHRQGIEVDET